MLIAMPISSCGDKGDNSDYDLGLFGGKPDPGTDPDTDPEPEPGNVYAGGYGRLSNSIRLATYNVHRGEPNVTQSAGTDKSDYALQASVIAAMDPDVIALQELDSITTWHPAYQLKELATRSGMPFYTYGYTLDPYRNGKYGNGVMSKTQPVAVHVERDLPGEEKRGFTACEFADYLFIATHLDHKNDDNRNSAAVIINRWVEQNYGEYAKPIFLAGDLNEADLNANLFKTLLPKWDIISTSSATFQGSSPSRIDYIMIWKGNDPQYEVLGTAVPRYEGISVSYASDHLPVIVDIKKDLGR